MIDQTPIASLSAEPLGGHIRVVDPTNAEWARSTRDNLWYCLGRIGGIDWNALITVWPGAVVHGRLEPVTADRGAPPTHRHGPDTERVSGDLIRPRTGTLRHRALEAIAAAEPRGLTDQELAAATGIYLYSIAPRRGELCRDGWVMDSGQRRIGTRNRPAVVWVLTGPGLEQCGMIDLARQDPVATVGAPR